MATVGNKRPRDSDNTQDTLTTADVAAGVTSSTPAVTAGPSSRKKAKTSNTTNEDDYDELADDDGSIGNMDATLNNASYPNALPAGPPAANPPASTSGATATVPPSVDVPTSAAEQPEQASPVVAAPAKPAPRRAQRKSALAAKDKIIAAESAADELDEERPATRASAKASAAEPQAEQGDAAKPASGSLVPPTVVPLRSRGRGGDRVPQGAADPNAAAAAAAVAAAAAAHSNTAAAIAALSQAQAATVAGAANDPSNPYLVRYGENPYAHIPMAGPPGMMMGHNPYMPPGPGGYAMFPGMPPYPMMHLPPGFEVPGQQPAANPAEGDANGEKKEEEGANGENSEAAADGAEKPADGSAPPPTGPAPTVPQQHPYGAYGFPPGFPAHMPPPEFVPNTNNPHSAHPYPHAHLLPPLHHPHPPNPSSHSNSMPHPGMQLTLPLAVTDHTLPSHMDAIIRAPDSLTISYAEVPDGAFLMRSDFAEPYPKQLEPPRKTTEMRCLFCKRHYSGPNARGMWRRHVTGKHDFVFERKAGSMGHTGGRQSHSKSAPIVMDSDHEGDGQDGGPNGQEGDGSGGPGGGPNEGGPGQGHHPMTMVGPDGMMGLLSLNGMPVNAMPPGGPDGMPPPHMQHHQQHAMAGHLQMLSGTNIPISAIPPHPVAPSNKRRPSSAPRSGVGMGNGGGGLVPRVHPLLSKEERIERARASKRHYAMKRRALEKMKQGGIPKGSRLVEGMFILSDGTQIPADPNVEYRDLSIPSGSRANAGLIGGDEGHDEDYGMHGDGDESGVKKRTRARGGKGKARAGRGKKQEDDDDDDDDEDDEVDDDDEVEGMVDGEMEEPSTEGLVRMDAPTGISVDMDPWQDQAAAAAYHAQLQAVQGSMQHHLPPGQPYPGKLAEIPVVPRGFKPPPMHAEIQPPPPAGVGVAASGRPPRKNARKKQPPATAAAAAAAMEGESPVVDQQPAASAEESPRNRRASARGKAAAEQQVDELPHPDGGATSGTQSGLLPPGIIPPGEDEEERRFCYCDDVEYGNMIGCDNGPKCSREWFHLACTDIEGPIPTSWFCRDCRKTVPSTDVPAADPSMEVGESSIPAIVPEADEAAATAASTAPATVAPAAEEAAPAVAEEMPRLRARRGRPPKSKAAEPESSTSPAPKPKSKKGGAKRGRKPKAKAGEEEEEKELSLEPEEGDEVESEDELAADDAAAGPSSSSPPKKPVSEAKSTSVTESPGRTRRSARMAAAS